ncbi:hypothetical protein EV421DRAFT_1733794 [Armillaria borealis]|uniref:Uncharacterized protein n=1 Tax=Armillaria borealis TaxID=47425 RepID=A0AA39JSS0_9AGAR|nr:hypothetical protein EV421DRAFT_1733794 [Armillaria borealis]
MTLNRRVMDLLLLSLLVLCQATAFCAVYETREEPPTLDLDSIIIGDVFAIASLNEGLRWRAWVSMGPTCTRHETRLYKECKKRRQTVLVNSARRYLVICSFNRSWGSDNVQSSLLPGKPIDTGFQVRHS